MGLESGPEVVVDEHDVDLDLVTWTSGVTAGVLGGGGQAVWGMCSSRVTCQRKKPQLISPSVSTFCNQKCSAHKEKKNLHCCRTTVWHQTWPYRNMFTVPAWVLLGKDYISNYRLRHFRLHKNWWITLQALLECIIFTSTVRMYKYDLYKHC